MTRLAPHACAQHHLGNRALRHRRCRTIELAKPAIERRKVVELAQDRLDDAKAGTRGPGAIAVALEQLEGLLEASARGTWAGVRKRRAVVVQQIGTDLQYVRRQKLEPGRQGRVALLLDEQVGVLPHDSRDLAPVASFDEQGERIFRLSRLVQQRCRAVARIGTDRVGQVPRRTSQQELAQQRMEHEHPAFRSDELAYEVVVVGKVEQHARRAVFAGEGAGHLDRHPRQAGDVEQQALRRRVEALEDLASQIVEDDLGGRLVRCCGRPGRVAELVMLDHQHQGGGPAVRALPHLRQRVRGELVAAQCSHCRKLAGRDLQIVSACAHHLAARLQAREAHRWGRAAGDDDAALPRHLRQAGRQNLQQRAFGIELVEVVEHQGDRAVGAREQGAKEAPRESGEVVAVFRSVCRQLVAAKPQFAHRMRDVVEERLAVVVLRIDLVPGPAIVPCLEVTGRQRRLAEARRRRDPDDGARDQAIEACEQRLTGDDAGDLGPRRLRERCRRRTLHHVMALSHRTDRARPSQCSG